MRNYREHGAFSEEYMNSYGDTGHKLYVGQRKYISMITSSSKIRKLREELNKTLQQFEKRENIINRDKIETDDIKINHIKLIREDLNKSLTAFPELFKL